MNQKNENFYESDILESVHEIAQDLYNIGLIDAEAIHEFDQDCLADMEEGDTALQIGDLFAYIEREASPEVISRIESSAIYQQQAAEMRQMSNAFTNLFTEAKLVDRLDLVDVAAGQATANQRLIVAAHCRRDPAIAAELEELKRDWPEVMDEGKQSEPVGSWLTGLLSDFTAKPLWAGAGTRSSADSSQAQQTGPQTYELADLDVQVTPQFIFDDGGENWRLEGNVLQKDQPVEEVDVILLPEGTHTNPTLTNKSGTFVFDGLEAGTYHLYIVLLQGIIEIPDLELIDDEL